jgi:putative peptidoglycan lipid II flippase
MIASLLPTGAVAALSCGQVISVLPVSLFSMSISAAELPGLSSATGTDEEIAAQLRTRLSIGLRRIAFLIIPSAVAFLLLGDVLAAALYQSGRFRYSDALDVWAVLAGSAVGLLATSLGRLYSSTFYALLDTRTPLRFAVLRVFLTITLGYVGALWLPAWLGLERKLGVAGLTASAGIAGWVEFTLLRSALKKRIGATPLPKHFAPKLWLSAFVGGSICFAIKIYLGHRHPILLALLVVPIYGAVYFAISMFLGIDDARSFLRPVIGRFLRLKPRAGAL